MKNKNIEIKSSYLHDIFSPIQFKKIAHSIARVIRKNKPNTIICKGVSGTSIAFAVSMLTGIPVGVVRRRNTSHSSLNYEGPKRIGNYIIIDDFIETGKTIKEIKRIVDKECLFSNCKAVIMYSPGIYVEDQIKITKRVFGINCKFVLCPFIKKKFGFGKI